SRLVGLGRVHVEADRRTCTAAPGCGLVADGVAAGQGRANRGGDGGGQDHLALVKVGVLVAGAPRALGVPAFLVASVAAGGVLVRDGAHRVLVATRDVVHAPAD